MHTKNTNVITVVTSAQSNVRVVKGNKKNMAPIPCIPMFGL